MAMVGRSCKQMVQSAAFFLFLGVFTSGVCAGKHAVQIFAPTSMRVPAASRVATLPKTSARGTTAATDITCGGSSSWNTYLKKDSPGNDLIGWMMSYFAPGDGWKFCANECMKDCNCVGFNLSPKVNDTEVCWLKYYIVEESNMVTTDGWDLFTKTCTSDVSWSALPRRDSPGNDIVGWVVIGFGLTDAFDFCATECAKDCSCRGFNLSPKVNDTQVCWMKYFLEVEANLVVTNDWDLYAKKLNNPPPPPPPSPPCASPPSPPPSPPSPPPPRTPRPPQPRPPPRSPPPPLKIKVKRPPPPRTPAKNPPPPRTPAKKPPPPRAPAKKPPPLRTPEKKPPPPRRS